MVIVTDSAHGSIDASDLGLAPGRFPNTITVTLPQGETSLVRAGCIFRRGEVVGWEYEAPDGFFLTVYND